MDTKNAVIEIYTEYTPNPESLKFVTNRMLLQGDSVDFRKVGEAEHSQLALELFDKPYVEGVFIANNFVTVTKKQDQEWEALIPEIKMLVKDFLASGKTVVEAKAQEPAVEAPKEAGDNPELENRIKELLDNYVKPAVENDGGAIQFHSYKDGVVKLILQGSCSGCPSSMVTLKAGIEGLLKRMIPEVKSVEAEGV